MAKKSSSGRHKPATAHGKGPGHKPQAPERVNSTATLVRPNGQPGPSAANVVADTAPAAKPATAKSATAKAPSAARPAPAVKSVAKPAAKPAVTPAAPAATAASASTAKPAATAAKPAAAATATARPAATRTAASAREQNARMARVRATQRARTDHVISAESYSYVLGDLKLVVGLAVTAFAVLIALTFVLPH